MRFPKIQDLLKKITDILPKKDVEKIALKILVAIWIIVTISTFGLRFAKDEGDDIEKKISDAATKVPISPSVNQGDMKKYEKLINLSQYPEPMSEYDLKRRRDPFSKYVEEAAQIGAQPTEHDFTLKTIGRVPLPVVYRGFIELPNKLIGQINWKDSTRFVEKGSSLNGYKILTISKEKIGAVDEQGVKWDFVLNKPVPSDKLNAVLYDKISKKTYTVEASSVIDGYKVIDIQPDCVILLSKGSEIKLTEQ
ncbi:MAG: hypothetical protein KKI13_05200 [Candidatus Omnitrophica bacterium]|nr:hypothetical protein [Candidatus Omnitrophota bacterium]